jgi:hypothetical protein
MSVIPPLSRTPGKYPLCRCGHTRASHAPRRRLCYGGSTCGCSAYEPATVARCGQGHPKLAPGNVCREPAGHDGQHMAHDHYGRPEYVWGER